MVGQAELSAGLGQSTEGLFKEGLLDKCPDTSPRSPAQVVGREAGMFPFPHPYATAMQPSHSLVPFLSTALPDGLGHFVFCFAGWHWPVQVIPEPMLFQLGFGGEGSFAV